MRRRLLAVLGVILALFPALLVSQGTQDKLYEAAFLSVPNAESAEGHLNALSSQPHVAGTIYGYNSAIYVRDKFLSYGLDTQMIPFRPLLVYPYARQVTMLQPYVFNASLTEQAYPEDPSSSNPNILPTYNAYSPNAQVTASVIYVNYGRVEDYEYLYEVGVTVQGAIAAVKYGKISRMSKVLLAQVQGAVGVLLYSDPADYGFVQGPVYTTGPWGPASRVEVGTIAYASICPGEPTFARMQNCLNDMTPVDSLLPDIPTQPISWADAYPIISNLQGPVAPPAWQGGMNTTYRLGTKGAGAVIVELMTISNWTSANTVWNVIGTIKGASDPDNVIYLGNHRDGWRFGTVDPSSGTSVLLEVARGLTTIMNTTQWRPSRTIQFCSWDAEEFAFIGSTKFVEDNIAKLSTSAIAYMNVDIGVSGPTLLMAATPSFRSLLVNATQAVMTPDNSSTLYTSWSKVVGTLGSGSDYVPFLDHAGVASIDISFYSDAYSGVYHSAYDSLYWMEKFGGMPYLRTCAQLYGLVAMRLASSVLLPFNYTDYGIKLTEYAMSIRQMIIDNGGEEELTVTPLMNAIEQFNVTAAFLATERLSLEAAIAKSTSGFSTTLIAAITHYNERAKLAERNFTTASGLDNQGRPWFKHLIQAPAIFDGYTPDPLPGLAQAIRDQNWPLALGEMSRIAACIVAASVFLRDAPPFKDEYAGPILAIRVASVAWACVIFLLLLGLTAFFIWRYLKTRQSSYDTRGDQEYEYMFLSKEETTPLSPMRA